MGTVGLKKSNKVMQRYENCTERSYRPSQQNVSRTCFLALIVSKEVCKAIQLDCTINLATITVSESKSERQRGCA